MKQADSYTQSMTSLVWGTHNPISSFHNSVKEQNSLTEQCHQRFIPELLVFALSTSPEATKGEKHILKLLPDFSKVGCEGRFTVNWLKGQLIALRSRSILEENFGSHSKKWAGHFQHE